MATKKLYFSAPDDENVSKSWFKNDCYFYFRDYDLIEDEDYGPSETLYEVEFRKPLKLGSVYNRTIEKCMLNMDYGGDYDDIDELLEYFGTEDKEIQEATIDTVINKFDVDGLEDAPYYSYNSGSLEPDGIMVFYPYILIKSVKKLDL